MVIKKYRFVGKLFLFSYIVLFLLICMFHTVATAQSLETERTITTVTNRGDITLKLFLYDTSALDPNKPLYGIVTFKMCSALNLGDPNLSPPGNPTLLPPWGDFPYGLWRSQISLTHEFDPNIHKIILEIYFPGQIDPLNAQYWTQEYDNDKKNIVWKEFKQNPVDQRPPLFFPSVAKPLVTITLSDFWLSDHDEVNNGFGDRDPNQWVIDHVGCLLWPIPGGGRCFIFSSSLP